uniref:UBC core domain-containing protein n=1 Tax=Branchiostoma floridae TaxID=7739 RepID=C3XTG1_BRAFL|eukprot:XP_002612578.1 hypothetical protein BRAFLDRAFT_78802 [Branchiostoma floridae]
MVLKSIKFTQVQKELAALRKSCPLGIQVSLPSDNLHEWEAVIPGPEDSLYKGRISYVHFLTPIYHLNVSQVCGQVCLRFLSEDEWVAGGTIEQVLSALFSLLIRPEENNAFDHDVLNTYHHFRRQYNKMACNSAKKAK